MTEWVERERGRDDGGGREGRGRAQRERESRERERERKREGERDESPRGRGTHRFPTDRPQAARGWARALARERVTALRTARNRVLVERAGVGWVRYGTEGQRARGAYMYWYIYTYIYIYIYIYIYVYIYIDTLEIGPHALAPKNGPSSWLPL